MRLPMRRTSCTVWPAIASMGGVTERRTNGLRQRHLFEHPAADRRPQRFHVDHDVWKFRHWPAFYVRSGIRGI